ncbi:MAG: threonine synthase [Treponema sp.]|jgi:threonine synthase|nr:threonine synthase [Treponema sp.]
MHYFSTRNKSEGVSFARAALTGLAPDGGLFVPEEIPCYREAVRVSLGDMDLCDIAFETIRPYVEGDIPAAALEELVQGAFSFAAPLTAAGDRPVLELFHGPTAAFKDFGARFMARAFSYLRRQETKPLQILVATSGDTGGAVADGFFGVEGISVTVLYPKGRVSPLQEKQIAGLGGNITALAVEGSFDDCQRLVKAALAGGALRRRCDLSSANSINVSRLIPQAVYYAAAAGKALAGRLDAGGEATPRGGTAGDGRELRGPFAPVKGRPAVVCVPSGNFGNLTAGLYAMKMGAPVRRFIAATNINRTVPDYLAGNDYRTRQSQATLSNAMDVGAPSNFERMTALFSHEEMRRVILGVSVTDEETKDTIAGVYRRWDYFIDPHSAVGWKGADKLYAAGLLTEDTAAGRDGDCPLIVLSTAHPAKFAETVESAVGAPVPLPPSLVRATDRAVSARTIPAETGALLEILV